MGGVQLAERTRIALRRACDHLLSLQEEDGHWCGELEADSVLESEYLLLLHFLGRGGGDRARRAAEHVRRLQLPDGGWAIYPGGPPDVSATVKAYFVLKLDGDDPDAPHMRKAAETVRRLGGLEAANTYTKIYLALFGQYPWDRCPSVPPEMILFPEWFYFNVHEMSSWSRGIFVPLSIIWAHRPVRPVPDGAEVPELLVEKEGSGVAPTEDPVERAWHTFFHSADRVLKLIEANGVRPARRRALEAAEEWILERLEGSDGPGAIFPGILNSLMAFDCLEYPEDHPAVASLEEALEKLIIEEEETLRLQPALSPVWDTAQSVAALRDAGVPADHPALLKAAEWLVEHEVRRPGDWRYNNPDGVVSGWYFEYANEFYPDCDDTAEVLMALGDVRPDEPVLSNRVETARRRGLGWLLSMQNEDGGWAAFDRGCDKEPLTRIPFADHNAMIDPSCEDITGRVLELLAREGMDLRHPRVRRAAGYLRRKQREDGTWYGRWGCNYIYGTWLALVGLAAVGEDMSADRYQRAADWLESVQNEDGGWGESPASYGDPSRKGVGPSTAAQTAWALMGLRAAGRGHSESARRGLDYLIERQLEDGSWNDEHWTGTGFPQVFYLRYHLYDDYFPLLALAAFREGAEFGRRDGRGAAFETSRELLETG